MEGEVVSLGLSELGFGRIVEIVVSEAARHGGEASVHRGRRGASERQSTPRATQPSHMSTCPLSMKRTGVAGILGGAFGFWRARVVRFF